MSTKQTHAIATALKFCGFQTKQNVLYIQVHSSKYRREVNHTCPVPLHLLDKLKCSTQLNTKAKIKIICEE